MDLPNLDLKKVLLSPKSGMDLQQGVPAQGKIELRNQKDFESHLENSKIEPKKSLDPTSNHTREVEVTAKKGDAKVRNLVQTKKEDTSPDKVESCQKRDSSESANQAEKQPDQKVEVSKSDKEQAEKDSDDLSLMQAIRQQIQAANSEPIVKTGDSEEPSDSLLENISEDASTANSNLSQTITLNQIKNMGDLKAADASKLSAQNQSKVKNSELNSEDLMAELNDLPESKSSFDLSSENIQKSAEDLGAVDVKAKSLKSMVDSLWVQSNLEGQNPTQPLMIAQPGKFEVANAKPEMALMRSNLISDMKPLISHVITNQVGGEMTLNLRPADLGLVRVEVKVDSGDVKVAIHAEQAASKTALQGQVSELKEQLASAGLKVHEVSVHLMKPGESDFQKNPNLQQQSKQQQQEANSFRQAQDEPGDRNFDEAMNDSSEGRKVA